MPNVEIPGVGVVEFPEDMPADSIQAVAARLHRNATVASSPEAAADAAMRGPAEPGSVDWRVRALAALPSAGGLVGGALGGGLGALEGGLGALPGAALGAGLGGAAGRYAENLGRGAMGLPAATSRPLGLPVPQVAQGILSGPAEGLNQAAMEALGGGLLASGAQRAARPLMERSLKISSLASSRPVSPRQLREFAETALEHRIAPGGREVLGSERAVLQARTSGRELVRVLKRAGKAGVTVDPKVLGKRVLEQLDGITYQPLASEDKQAIRGFVESFLRDHPEPLTPYFAKRMLREAQAVAKPIIERRGVRPGVNAADAVRGRFHDAFATVLREELRRLPKGYGGQVGRIEDRTAALLRLRRPLERAEAATSKVSFSPFGPLRPFGAATPTARVSRPTVGRMALAASGLPLQFGLRQTPRLVDLARRQLFLTGSVSPELLDALATEETP